MRVSRRIFLGLGIAASCLVVPATAATADLGHVRPFVRFEFNHPTNTLCITVFGGEASQHVTLVNEATCVTPGPTPACTPLGSTGQTLCVEASGHDTNSQGTQKAVIAVSLQDASGHVNGASVVQDEGGPMTRLAFTSVAARSDALNTTVVAEQVQGPYTHQDYYQTTGVFVGSPAGTADVAQFEDRHTYYGGFQSLSCEVLVGSTLTGNQTAPCLLSVPPAPFVLFLLPV